MLPACSCLAIISGVKSLQPHGGSAAWLSSPGHRVCGANHGCLQGRCAIHSSFSLISVLMGHMATWATGVKESTLVGAQVGQMGSPPVIQMDERQSHLTEKFAQQPSIPAGCMPVLCCVLGHGVFFSYSVLL